MLTRLGSGSAWLSVDSGHGDDAAYARSAYVGSKTTHRGLQDTYLPTTTTGRLLLHVEVRIGAAAIAKFY